MYVDDSTNDSVMIFFLVTPPPRKDESTLGEVSIQADLFTHPGTGEHKVTVKGKLFVNIIIILSIGIRCRNPHLREGFSCEEGSLRSSIK